MLLNRVWSSRHCCGGFRRSVRSVSVCRALPARRPGSAYVDFIWDGDDLDDGKDKYQDFLRETDPLPFTPIGGRRRPTTGSSNLMWRNFDNNYDMDTDLDDQLLEEYAGGPAKPVTLSEDKRFIQGKQILTNYDITAPLLRVVGEKKEQIGMKTREVALQMALDAQVDLILINPQEAPPVARLMEWSKYKFEIEQGEKTKKAKAVVVETKEVRLSPKTDDHDISTKTKSTQRFLDKGNKVKLVMKFEGRQLQHKDHGKEVLLKFIAELGDGAKVEGPLSFKGSMYTVVLIPGKTAGAAAPAPAAAAPAPAAAAAAAPAAAAAAARPAAAAAAPAAARPAPPAVAAQPPQRAPAAAPNAPPPPPPLNPPLNRPGPAAAPLQQPARPPTLPQMTPAGRPTVGASPMAPQRPSGPPSPAPSFRPPAPSSTQTLARPPLQPVSP